MYEVIILPKAEKQLEKLDWLTQQRILNVLSRLKIRPFAHVKKLVASPHYRARAGKYRIILNIIKNKLLILVLEIGPRPRIYK